MGFVVACLLAQTPAVSLVRARAALSASAELCAVGSDSEQVHCLLKASALGRDQQALLLALRLYDELGHVVAVLPAEDFEGGYRGVIRLVPQWPVGAEVRHVRFVFDALREIDALLADTARLAHRAAPRFRSRGLVLRFFRSVKRRTPAAFAIDWSVSYNTHGSLNDSLAQVRGLLFHEVFHLNDAGWSSQNLSDDYDAIVRRCGTDVTCLTPLVPEPLLVRVANGTYYSFMPGNGVTEYAADLALRYFKEQTEVLAGRIVKKPFKCGPAENGRAWAKLVNGFFAGVDRVPQCTTQ
jgi:hypothetical protein